jgi:hypothetical protein
MSAPMVTPLLQRSLSVVYRFYDAFVYPTLSDKTPAIDSQLEVSILKFGWNALRSDDDLTYRFSWMTLTQAPPAGANLDVQVVATAGDYINLDPFQVTLPLAVSSPPKASDFLQEKPLWPAESMRPPVGETAVRGRISNAANVPAGGVKVEMWTGGSPLPPSGTPFTQSAGNGCFIYRFPLLAGARGSIVTVNVRLNNGVLLVTPSSLPVIIGQLQIFQLKV